MTDKRMIPGREYTGIDKPESEGQRRRRASDNMREAVAQAQSESRTEHHERRLDRNEKNIADVMHALHELDKSQKSENATLLAFRDYAIPTLETLVTRKEFDPVRWLVYWIAGTLAVVFIASIVFRR